MNVAVIGLGEVGAPTLRYVAHRFTKAYVTGYDISQSVLDRLRTEGLPVQPMINLRRHSVYLIDVPTNRVVDVLDALNPKPDDLISIESTVEPRFFLRPDLPDAHIVHCPHRFWKGDPVNRGVRQLRVFGSLNEEAWSQGFDFYWKRLKIPLISMSSAFAAALVKVTENAYRYLQIAFTEELSVLCEKLQPSGPVSLFKELADAANAYDRTWRPEWTVHILEARDGIGGHCLPLAAEILRNLGSDLVGTAIRVDDEYRKWKKATSSAPRWERREP